MPRMTFFQPDARPDDTRQKCPFCGREQPLSQRYPQYACWDCSEKAVDENGRPLVFYNTSFGGGFEARYRDTDELRTGNICFIDGVECWADEARFGGIVIQPRQKPLSDNQS